MWEMWYRWSSGGVDLSVLEVRLPMVVDSESGSDASVGAVGGEMGSELGNVSRSNGSSSGNGPTAFILRSSCHCTAGIIGSVHLTASFVAITGE